MADVETTAPRDPSPHPPSSRRWLVVAAVIVLPLAVLGAVYLLFFTGDSPDELTLSTPPSTQAQAQAGSQAPTASGLSGTWTVAPGSVAGYRVREKLARLPAQSDGVGRTEAVTGTVVISQDGAALTADKVDVTVDVTKLASDEDRRDSRIRSTGLESDRFPTATFTSTAAVPLPPPVSAGGSATVDMPGKLTIHGVTKDVTIPVDVRLAGPQGEAVGSLTFPFSDFGMRPPSIGGFVTVDDNATMEFKVLLVQS